MAENPYMFKRDYENDGESVVYDTDVRLRDMFAAAALAGYAARWALMLPTDELQTGEVKSGDFPERFSAAMAVAAFRAADAMLAERSK